MSGLVVGAAVVRDGAVLAARRTAPPEAAGRWEFPGGKLEPGEDAEAALRRELVEELGVHVEVVEWLPVEVDLRGGLRLRVALCRTDDEPRPHEHDRLAWLRADELEDVPWLPADRPFLEPVRRHLVHARTDEPEQRRRA